MSLFDYYLLIAPLVLYTPIGILLFSMVKDAKGKLRYYKK